MQHSIVGIRSRVESGVELQDTMMMGADFYQTEAEIASLLAEGKVPIGVGENTKIRYLIPNKAESSVVAIHCLTSVVLCKCRNCIIDKNAKIGKNVVIANADVYISCSHKSFVNNIRWTFFSQNVLCVAGRGRRR